MGTWLRTRKSGGPFGVVAIVATGAVWFASACGETKSQGTSGTTSSDTQGTQATIATDGASSSATSAGGSGSDASVETAVGGTSAVSSVSVGNLASGGSVTSEGSSDTTGTGGADDDSSSSSSSASSSGGGGGQISSGGANSTLASAALSLTAASTTNARPVCANGGRDTPLCLTDEEMEYQARYGYGLEPLDPPRSDEEIADAWDEQGCLPGNWVGSACCNPGVRTVGRLGNECCYITCEGEVCCGGFPTGTNTSTTGGF